MTADADASFVIRLAAELTAMPIDSTSLDDVLLAVVDIVARRFDSARAVELAVFAVHGDDVATARFGEPTLADGLVDPAGEVASVVVENVDLGDKGSVRWTMWTTEADDVSGRLFGIVANQTAPTVQAAVEMAQMRRALNTRDLIGQAKGMLMERYDVDADEAFALVTRLSQESNTKVAEVARLIVEAGPQG
ncbi:ANTAR domain-containing protein [Gordonia soli]|uniref:ANTAR domain-containing protein n=1 Tax=Gordonia soli NBRC 108243 TaxID=1223545 RepID=M0QR75_9ACTN|nr:ANTAR domain-containing protein [Gordonia soli]GAC69947.1 hypothetical protein GS4_30_00180 [Gordonia soli NBRC 108243]